MSKMTEAFRDWQVNGDDNTFMEHIFESGWKAALAQKVEPEITKVHPRVAELQAEIAELLRNDESEVSQEQRIKNAIVYGTSHPEMYLDSYHLELKAERDKLQSESEAYQEFIRFSGLIVPTDLTNYMVPK